MGRTGILQSLWNLGIQASGDRVRRSGFHAAVLRSMNQEPRRWLKARAFQKESPGFSRGEDVNGVEIVSNAFADEVFGKLVKNFGLDELRKNSSFKDAHREVALVVQKVINDRLAA